MPDGTKLKRLDISKIKKLGWKPKIDINTGIKKTISEFKRIKKYNWVILNLYDFPKKFK